MKQVSRASFSSVFDALRAPQPSFYSEMGTLRCSYAPSQDDFVGKVKTIPDVLTIEFQVQGWNSRNASQIMEQVLNPFRHMSSKGSVQHGDMKLVIGDAMEPALKQN